MYKQRGKLDDQLLDSLPPYDKDRIQGLLEEIQKGNTSIREALILQLLSVCRVELSKRVYQNPELRKHLPDLIGTLMLKTCSWVDSLNGKKNIFFSYYVQLVKNEINNFNSGDNNPNISGSHFRFHKKHGIPLPTRVQLTDALLQINPTEVIDMTDVLLTLAETELEQDIVILKFQGYSESEIAGKLNITQAYVNLIKLNLEKRYIQYMKQINEDRGEL
jgi:DNA-directed RNA polymerase specialized sigma subunit